MTRDPKQTQTMEETREQDLALRTTIVQPIPLSRHPDFVRTHYWEKRSREGEPDEPKRTAKSYASAGKTVAGLGPDDPIVQAVQAAKEQLRAAERAQNARAAKTVRMAALDVVQLMAARVKPTLREEALQLPKRKLKPLLIAGAALPLISIGAYFIVASPSEPQTDESIVQPRPQSAPEPQRRAVATASPAPAATSVNAPVPVPQLSEKAAVDALFAGDYSLASRHYAVLASAHPEQPAFAEAARILQRNTQPDTR